MAQQGLDQIQQHWEQAERREQPQFEQEEDTVFAGSIHFLSSASTSAGVHSFHVREDRLGICARQIIAEFLRTDRCGKPVHVLVSLSTNQAC